MVLGSHDVSRDLLCHLTSGYTFGVDNPIKNILNFIFKVNPNGTGYIAAKIAATEKSHVKKKIFSYLPTQYFWVYVSPNKNFF